MYNANDRIPLWKFHHFLIVLLYAAKRLAFQNKKDSYYHSYQVVNKFRHLVCQFSVYVNKLVDIVIKVKNKTAEEQKVSFENIQLECGGSSSCIYLTLINTTTNRYSNLGVTLMPGEERECIFPVLLANSTFSNNDWKHLEDKLYWLTFSDYPVKTKLYF